jgi:hypothetical protein
VENGVAPSSRGAQGGGPRPARPAPPPGATINLGHSLVAGRGHPRGAPQRPATGEWCVRRMRRETRPKSGVRRRAQRTPRAGLRGAGSQETRSGAVPRSPGDSRPEARGREPGCRGGSGRGARRGAQSQDRRSQRESARATAARARPLAGLTSPPAGRAPQPTVTAHSGPGCAACAGLL